MKKNKLVGIVFGTIFFLAIIMFITSRGTGEIPVSKKSPEPQPVFKNAVFDDSDVSVTFTHESLNPHFNVINPNYANCGFLDKNLFYIFDDVNLHMYEKKGEEWKPALKFLNEGQWTSKSTISGVSGNKDFAHIKTFDETMAAFLSGGQATAVPSASCETLELSTLAPNGTWGISFSDSSVARKFQIDRSGLITEQVDLPLQGLATDLHTEGELEITDLDITEIQSGYIMLAGQNDKKIIGLVYDEDGALKTKIKTSIKKIGKPVGFIKFKKHYLLSGSKGIELFDEKGKSQGTIESEDFFKVKKDHLFREIIGIAENGDSVMVCLAAELQERAPIKAYCAKMSFEDNKKNN